MINKYDNKKTYVNNYEDYKKYVNLTTKINRWILDPLGIWPFNKDSIEVSWKDKCFRRFKSCIFYFLMIFVFACCGPYIIFEVDGTYDRLRLTGPLSFCVMAILKYVFLTLHEEKLRSCIGYIEMDWKSVKNLKDEQIMIDKVYSGRRLVNICNVFTFGAAGFYYIVLPVMSKKIVLPDVNVTYRPTPYPVTKYLIDIRYSPANEIVSLILCFSGFAAHSIAAGTCSLVAIFTMHVCGQLRVLINWLEHLLDGREDLCSNVDGRMASIIQQHVQILNFISVTENLLNEISLIEVVGCTLNMCLLGYYCIMEWDITEILGSLTCAIVLTSIAFNIFIFCYIGELLMEQVNELSERCYGIDWYRLPGKTARSLILLIAMSRTTTKLTAGNFMDLSLSSFSDIIKSSVVYLNMLRTVT
ncbi:uncharacterized protein LOC122515328 [Polistes fuscatus]|uniref:uncharacterized protein LOC122515328 n=1 Tax=Polistes fuscatus TaxID=30207 RepID=UPI001CA9982F|nr:uncharacterized protein LOC122515328 [Polistes fuscatus]